MKRYEKFDRVVLKKSEANKLDIFPECLVISDGGEFITVKAVGKNFEDREIIIEREQLLKRYQ
jgi:hypothetical protein